MRSLTACTFTISLALLHACGGEPGTTATDSATGASTGSTTTATTDPGTTSTGDPNPTTSGASDSASGSSGPGTTGTTAETTTSTTAETTTTDATTTDASTSTTADTTTGASTGAIMDCAALEQAFAAETLAIRSCKLPSDCGVELKMTSCGCTHNWVARKDADTTQFYDLLALGQDLQCELIGPGICDCPAADGFTCTQGICNWNYT